MLPDIIHNGVPIHWSWETKSWDRRYDLPLTHTMWKLVEAVEYVDFLKAQKPGNREHAFLRALDGAGLYAP